ncbi:hypothetical protein O3M35_005629 [Rhynocoris fuscipes]|uniref:ATP synthase mitochondrial F1 complex assembly factor 2 n=1 Tax=Rhynocoris fuscipes TaxID=488301 RepID=A0AAW1DKV3_9HEMI
MNMFNLFTSINRCSPIVRNSDKLRSIISHEYAAFKCYATAPKRFYKKVGIISSGGLYEITLDNRKVKTPKGNVFKVDNKILALMIAKEWDSQLEEIQSSTMHLTALCNTALENPNHVVKEEAVDKLMGYLETDAVLYHSRNEEVNALQKREWSPLIEWFNKDFEVNINATTTFEDPSIPSDSKEAIRNHLLSYNLPSIHGFNLAVESLKSLILTLSCVRRRINVEQAVLLSRLEEEYQAGQWGRVEWAHDIAQVDLQARVAAGIIFIQLNSMSEDTKSKLAIKQK